MAGRQRGIGIRKAALALLALALVLAVHGPARAEISQIEMMLLSSPFDPPGGTVGYMDQMLPPTAVTLSGVPTSNWTYGCGPTAAGMLFGYYDRNGFPNMYLGPANGGVAPLTDLGNQCSLIATKQGFDGRTTRGHVDDYYVNFGAAGPDPWQANGWTQHAWGDCVADYMGSNQWKWDSDLNGTRDYNTDGATRLFVSDSTFPLYDYIPPAANGLPQTEFCHGLKLFAESRGYQVPVNFTQRIDTYIPPGGGFFMPGFSFDDYMYEIDQGCPVIIQLTGHSMLGVGYNEVTQTVYVHDGYGDYLAQMTWGGTYMGNEMGAVTVVHLEPNPATLRWTGAADNTWAIGPKVNWSAGGAPLAYDEGSPLIFDDSGANTQPVAITGLVHPASVLVSNDAVAVELSGTGAIAGPCRLTKAGPGALVIWNANAYTGGTEVSGGTLLAENTAGSATGTGAVTVSAATLGGTGFINGPVTLTGDATLTSTGTLTINNTLTIQGLANQLAAGTVLTSGDVTIESWAVFIINGTLGGDSGSLIVYGTLMGKGTINKSCVIEAGGVLSPGSPSTIQVTAQILNAAAPRNFSFEIGAASPNYASPSDSVNDVIRLTDAAIPFADATGAAPAALSADTVMDVYFLWSDPAMGEYKAQFFAATDFSDAVADATYQYWRLDPRGSRYHNGNLFSPLDASLVDWSVVPETATFDGQAAGGYITKFEVVPEPATLALVALGGLLSCGRMRRLDLTFRGFVS